MKDFYVVIIRWWHGSKGSLETIEKIFQANSPETAIARVARENPMPHGWSIDDVKVRTEEP